MSEFKVASRYAKSLIDLALEQNALEDVKRDIEQFVAVAKANTELQAVLKNPIIKQDKKRNILQALFGATIHPAISAFFTIMVRKGRAGILYATAQEFIREYNEVKNIVKAHVTSAETLSDVSKKAIAALVKQYTGGEVIIESSVKPDLIGGFVLTVGDRQVDASISGRLNKLEKALKVS
ncbi:ATP synthase F1 subcomplex delta subunit [bacterium A37T11]|nr:ATP synthase F1 subcomplex delta subunit [bacterium A37T11]